MIRLGSLAGYPFEGPRLLAGWTPPASAAVYAIAYKPEPEAKPDKYAVIYVGHSDDLSAERFPFQHRRAHCWVRRAGSKWRVYICTYEVPGGGRRHREQIVEELIATYHPRCNDQQYDRAWKDEWIGGTRASSPSLAKDPPRPGTGTAAANPTDGPFCRLCRQVMWLIRAWRWIRGSIEYRINHEARIHHDNWSKPTPGLGLA